MSFSAVVAFLLIAFPLASTYDEYRSRDGAVNFLRHYGYLDSTADRSLITNDELRHAISLFQEYYHLPVDGTLNNATLRYMARPRCGVSNAPSSAQRRAVAVAKAESHVELPTRGSDYPANG
ncbi:Matrix metalloproteinase-24 [Ooceraea biroi]|uniref:Matrix metalloproteinase-24 n=1 Tax=Ooceraea biroi TaxID=2015173 RepID=A0A026WIH0_OOCBI|nr:Matrix metalloproteinase-24 [Ooceraea biroi]